MNIKKICQKAFNYFQNNQIEEAINLLEKSLNKFPNNAEILGNLGFLKIRIGSRLEAKELLDKSLSVKYDQKIANNLVLVLIELQLWELADVENNKLINLTKNEDINLLFNKAIISRGKRDFENAINIYNKILELSPHNLNAHLSKGFTYNLIEEYDLAIDAYRNGLKINSQSWPLIYNLGIALNNNQDYGSAVMYLSSASRRDINNIDALLTLAAAQMANNEIETARETIKKATLIEQNSKSKVSIAALYQDALIDFGDSNIISAKTKLEKVLNLDPGHIEAHFHYALILLGQKKYNEIHEHYSYRSLREKNKSRYGRYNDLIIPKLDINKSKVIVVWEQGVGDEILMVRLLDELKKKVKILKYVAKDKLISFFRNNFKEIEIISSDDLIIKENTEYKEYVKINLYSIFAFFVNFEDIIKKAKILKADQVKTQVYKDRYKRNNKPLIGLSWASKAQKIGKKKTVNLDKIVGSISNLKKYDFINLQYGDVIEEISEVEKKYNLNVNYAKDLDYFDDINSLAALIASCDMVITISNVTAHLAGSLGIKTILLLPKEQGKIWYWTEDSSKSSWYPSITIIQQEKDSNWESVLKELNSLCEKLLN